MRSIIFSYYFDFKISLILDSSNPTTTSPPISMTGTPICPVLSIISLRLARSVATLCSVKGIELAEKKFLANPQYTQVGVEYIVMFFILFFNRCL